MVKIFVQYFLCVRHLEMGTSPLTFLFNKSNAQTIAAMREAEKISKDLNVVGYTDLKKLFATLDA